MLNIIKKSKFLKLFFKKLKFEYWCLLAWIVFLIIFYYSSNFITGGDFVNGYKLGSDSPRYINAAFKIINGSLPDGKALSYLTYDFFLAFCIFVKINLFGSVIIQIFLTAIAALCLLKIGTDFWSENVGKLTFFIFLFYPHIQIRNFYILTESIFISLTIIGFYLITNKSKKFEICGFITLFFASFIRPNSIILLVIIFIKLLNIIINSHNKFYYYFFLIISLFLIIPVFNIVDILIGKEQIYNYMLSGAIIQGFPELNINPLVLENEIKSKYNIFKIISAFYQDPIYFFNMITTKLYWSILRYRPYYSEVHNYFILISSLTAYLFFIIGIFVKIKRNLILKKLIIYFIALTLLVIVFTFVDWSGRFFLPALPFIFLFSSAGFFHIFDKFYLKNVKN